MKIIKRQINFFAPIIILFFIIAGCAPTVDEKKEATATKEPVKEAKIEHPSAQKPENKTSAVPVPPVKWEPSFNVKEIELEKGVGSLPKLKVGANVETKGTQSIPLSTIIKKLAALKGFNVSWNQDVRKDSMVDVDIKADDDFWVAMDNILRQLDYYFEFKKDTLIIGYKQTKTYNLVVPPVSYNFTAAVGGNMVGNPVNTPNLGEVSLSTVPSSEALDWEKEKDSRYKNNFDVWKNVRKNLDTILDIWEKISSKITEEQVAETAGTGAISTGGVPLTEKSGTSGAGDQTAKGKQAGELSSVAVRVGVGSYTIDESLGTIMVTAPPSIQEKVKEYIDTVKTWLYKQISIEAHILEVQLSDETTKGIDWSRVLKAVNRESSLIRGTIGYGDQGNVYQVDYSSGMGVTREGLKLLGSVFLNDTSFDLLVNALDEQGHVRILSQPKLNLMNGSPGLLTVGKNISYVKEVSADITGTGVDREVKYSVKTDKILSGIAFSVMGNILGNDQLVLYITPVTSALKEPMEIFEVGDFAGTGGGVRVGLPNVDIRQIATMARIKDGDILIVGGLINDKEEKNASGVPILEKLPIIKWAFSNESKTKSRRELIVILKPNIINI